MENNYKEFEVNDSRIIVRIGNIVDSRAEVIVSSDDSLCSMGGGVSRAIHQRGGQTISEDVRKKVPAEVGDVVVSAAGLMPQKFIFHCITRKIHSGYSSQGLQEFVIQRTIDKSLKLLHTLGLSSIAFPVIGTGFARYETNNVLFMMAEQFIGFLYTTNKPLTIEVYVHDGNYKSMTYFTELCAFVEENSIILSRKKELFNQPAEKTETLEPIDSQDFRMAVSNPNQKHDIFISYSRKDIQTVGLFCKEMDNLGIPYWLDVTDTHTGSNFKEVLVDAIDNSKIVVFFSSKDSNQSPFVIKEIGLAVSAQKHIIPIHIDNTPYAKSIRFDLSDIDWIEYNPAHTESIMRKFKYCLQLYLEQ